MTLHKFQENVLKDTSSHILLGWARQTGKTEMTMEIAKRAVGPVAIILPSESQVTAMLNRMRPATIRKSTALIEVQLVAGGPTIQLLTPKYFDLHGIAYNITKYEAVIVEEPAHIPDDLVMNLFLTKNTKKFYLIGTPKKTAPNKRDSFTILHKLHKELGISVHEASFGDVLKERELQKLKESFAFDEDVWRTEVMAQFN